MDDELMLALNPDFGPQETALIETYGKHGHLSGYELLLPREWAARYVDEAAQRGLVILGIDFFIVTEVSTQPIHDTNYSDDASAPDAVRKCQELAHKDLDQWPKKANFASFTLSE